MRSEIKIGIAVGLGIAVVAVLYLVFAGPSAPIGPKAGQVSQGPGAAKPVNQVERAEPNQLARVSEALVPRIGTGAEAPAAPAVAEVPVAEAVPAAPAAPAIVPAVAPAPEATTQPVSPALPVKVEPSPAAAPGGIYIVKKGDNGFWSIAEKVYGQGKYWTLISKANPNVDSNNLAVGQELVIPPLPAVPPARLIAATAPAAASTGQKVHVVQQGDSWWSIAVKEYGDGRYWNEIKKANPHVEGNSLQVGTTLKIPPISKAAKPPPPATAPVAPQEEGDVRPVFD